MHLFIIVGKPDLTTYEKEIEIINNNVNESLLEARKHIPVDDLIIDFRVEKDNEEEED